MAVFITHISEEAPVALALRYWIDRTLLGQWPVFVSSDKDSITPGDRWLEDIEDALNKAKVMVMLCSSTSVKKPWVNFEAGCAFIRKIPIIPVCHSGLDKGDLPVPLSLFEGLNIEDDNFAQELFHALGTHLKVYKLPPIDYEGMKSALSDALGKFARLSAQEEPPVEKEDTGVGQLEEIEIEILKILAKADEHRPSTIPPGLTADVLGVRFKISPTTMRYYLDRLKEQEYVTRYQGMHTRFGLAKRGRDFLVEKGLI